ncbi:unnamed protein product [Zymoseptoria tritici ST99CH_1A5]|uniref:AvrStb6 n=1 Tax=Zymoseptoria tritici ST99CH_1A5 TaxID=1276529 RepID=A0A1Y6LIE5_ZYMTR|nr:unnamed protein product [Zymoseptoria tritici ST99CH_1A5]
MKLHVFGIIAVATLVTAWRPCAKGGEGAGCGAWPCCGHYGCGHDNQCHLQCEWGGKFCRDDDYVCCSSNAGPTCRPGDCNWDQ